VSALVSSELLKIRTTRGWYAYLAVVVLLVGIAVAGDIGSSPNADRSLLEFQLGLVESAGIAALLTIILGITVVTTEFRHGTITPTLLVEPRRERVLAAKAAAVTLVGILFALLALVVVAGVALIWLSIVGADIHLGDAEIGKRAVQMVLLSILWGLLGVAIGSVVHSQVAALVGTLIWIFLGETLLLGLLGLLDLDGARGYLPFQALDAADGSGGGDLLSYWPAVGVSLGWIVLLGAAGIVRTRRRDIT
jgi:ABC-type transport system involved in multi-copper enzyme maturation permease subunit